MARGEDKANEGYVTFFGKKVNENSVVMKKSSE